MIAVCVKTYNEYRGRDLMIEYALSDQKVNIIEVWSTFLNKIYRNSPILIVSIVYLTIAHYFYCANIYLTSVRLSLNWSGNVCFLYCLRFLFNIRKSIWSLFQPVGILTPMTYYKSLVSLSLLKSRKWFFLSLVLFCRKLLINFKSYANRIVGSLVR